jgi:hypothetical protein
LADTLVRGILPEPLHPCASTNSMTSECLPESSQQRVVVAELQHAPRQAALCARSAGNNLSLKAYCHLVTTLYRLSSHYLVPATCLPPQAQNIVSDPFHSTIYISTNVAPADKEIEESDYHSCSDNILNLLEYSNPRYSLF